MKWLWVVGVIAALAALSTACGGDKPAPSLSDADLKAIVTLTSEGLAQPIVVQSDSAVSNGQAARMFIDPAKWMNHYEKWGRTGGHTATFGVTGGVGASVQAQVEAYGTIDGATKALSAVRDFMTSGEALLMYSKAGYTDPKIDVIDAARVGDDSSAYRLVVTANEIQSDTLVVIFRRGAVLARASTGTAQDTTDSTDVEAVANQMDARIQSILRGQTATSQGN